MNAIYLDPQMDDATRRQALYDGQLIVYDNIEGDVDHLWVANADGSEPRQVFDQTVNDSWITWSGDSRHLSIVGGDQATTTPGLYIASVDGAGRSPGSVPFSSARSKNDSAMSSTPWTSLYSAETSTGISLAGTGRSARFAR